MNTYKNKLIMIWLYTLYKPKPYLFLSQLLGKVLNSEVETGKQLSLSHQLTLLGTFFQDLTSIKKA